MRVSISDRRISVVPGVPTYLTVTITNTSEVIAGYSIRFLGADPEWVTFDTPDARLFPDASTDIRVGLRLPVGVPAGARRMAVQVRELTAEQAVAIEEIVVTVPDQPGLGLRLDPSTVTAGRRGEFGVVIENNGNTVLVGALRGVDAEKKIDFAFTPGQFRLAPGETLTGRLRTKAKRPVFGALAVRPFGLFVDDGVVRASAEPTAPADPADPFAAAGPAAEEAPTPAAAGVFIQKPVFARGLLSMIGLLLAVSVFALVISVALTSVMARSAADRDLALQVAQARYAATTATGTAGFAGTVRLLSDGQPIAGVSVEAFDESDTSVAVATTASDDQGVFAIGNLPAGTYKIRMLGAGFSEVWYPAALTDADAQSLTLSAGQRMTGLSVLLGGVPATISGTVLGTDVAGATVQLQIPLDSPIMQGLVGAGAGDAAPESGNGAIVRTAPVGADGTFTLAVVPSPGVYDLVVSKMGFSTQVQRVDVAAGENRSGIEISLIEGDGSIAGTVTSADGPVAGATVIASFGQNVAQTVTLTQDAIGTFTLRGLQTPGTFTVVVSAPGYAPATLSVNLSEGQQLTGMSIPLGKSSGTLAGTVTTPAGTSSAGVTVTVTGGSVTRQTVTQSGSSSGAWRISNLPLPSTYTVTFSRADLESQVTSVTIDANGVVSTGSSAVTSIDASMRMSTGRITGTVTQAAYGTGISQPADNVQVTATSGAATFAVTSASTPEANRGNFVLENLPPGTYTVTFSRKGTRSMSSIVTLVAGQHIELTPNLVSPASITGRVMMGPDAVSGIELRLYTAEQFGTAAAPVMVTRSDSGGGYAFEDVDAPAHYIIEVRSAGGSIALTTSSAITIAQSDSAKYDFTLESLS
ncbi:Tfp pilus assembly protein PilW [Sanguibacter gelidistatuariae]|uniref:alpha-amylase n=1 Tax=Sanguibacter gelidistatuariae TaxID=1814289 RepID=A0A1G6MWZ8_9MICO|nr:carboxypeptidase-like regulatory domain-containing protein [Sanguibacter gelidistatuariae]SDC59764.1 Tfp pilus assembly protein PilW [Sanguibacter gelidistatuariae]